MFNGYPVCPAVTSLVLLASLFAASPSVPRDRACSDISRLYSPRLLREVRARLMLAYAESHELRAAEVAAAIRNHETLAPSLEPGFARPAQTHGLHPHESDGPKLKHLLAYIAINCL